MDADGNVNIWKGKALAGSKLPKQFNHPKQDLINAVNIGDNECFKWCLFRYLHPADPNSPGITKSEKD